MNNELTRVLLALFVFGSMVLSLACGGSSSNENTDDTPNASKDSICGEGDSFTVKKGKIEGYINQEMPQMAKLNQQKGERFHYEIVPFSTKTLLEVKITGLLRDKGKEESTFEDFLDIIDNLMMKKCIERVTFNKGAYPENSLMSDGFEWQACEHPAVYCPDGECRQTCPPNMNPANTSANTSNNSSNSNIKNSNSNAKNSNN